VNKKLYVGGIEYSVRDEGLRSHFEQAGTVTSATVLMERDQPNRSRGFGFVEMATEDEARKAIEMLDGSDLNGRRISVKEAMNREDRPQRGGGFGGGGGYSR
jgi:RNA recognition motif-containing protein